MNRNITLTDEARGRRPVWMSIAILVALLLAAITAFGVVTTRDDAARPRVAQETPGRVPRDRETPQVASPSMELAPVSVRIPDVGIDSRLVPLGLNADRTLEVPSDYAVAGWYIHRAVPGEPGPSILAGHVDSKTGPAVFQRLGELEPGATVEVERTDGSLAVFTVTATEQHDKDAFPTERVYGPTDSPELRVITCGGSFDRSIGHYNDNVVVFAELVQIVQ